LTSYTPDDEEIKKNKLLTIKQKPPLGGWGYESHSGADKKRPVA
jgi:hypothetical protein